MKILYFLLLLAWVASSAGLARADDFTFAGIDPATGAASIYAKPGEGVRVTYDAGGESVTLTRDANGMVQVDGLPYPGLVLYRPANGVVYYQHPSSPIWLLVQPGQNPAVSASTVAGPAWQPWENQPTQRWDVFAADAWGHKDGKQCDQWFASPTAEQQAGLSVADLSRILGVLHWLNAGGKTPACARLQPTAQQGVQIGLPLRWSTPNGPWQLVEVARTNVAPIALPEVVKPLDDAARLQILLSQFGKEQRENFIRSNAALPVSKQVELIEGAMDQGGGEAEDK